ncbi:hypothetical protein [Halorubrum aethiopicum]|uniref:hypothetical protein n=1 Tax=Halorubrum aethiopicum TaxID=1758255 RepID=UPI000A816841|nr:hypothetical protein [Halorubrum aethiopicum]
MDEYDALLDLIAAYPGGTREELGELVLEEDLNPDELTTVYRGNKASTSGSGPEGDAIT